MERLLLSIIYTCIAFGEVNSLLYLADSIGMNYSKAWERLRRLERRDSRLRVSGRGRGVPLHITYDCDRLPRNITVHLRNGGGITIPRDSLYRGSYGRFGEQRTDETQ